MARLPILLVSLIFAVSHAAANEEVSYTGIWQDKDYESDYYVIQENGDQVVLVALPGIEETADTLRFSYMGDRDSLEMSRLAPGTFDDIYQRVQLVFESAEEAHILPICDACSAVKISIVRVF